MKSQVGRFDKKTKVIAISSISVFVLIILLYLMIQPVKVGDVESLKINGYENGALNVDVSLRIDNPNVLSCRIMNIDMEMYLNGTKLGVVKNATNTIIEAGKEKLYTFNLDVKTGSMIIGALSLLKSLGSNEVNVEAKGMIKVKTLFLSKEIKINRTSKVDLYN